MPNPSPSQPTTSPIAHEALAGEALQAFDKGFEAKAWVELRGSGEEDDQKRSRNSAGILADCAVWGYKSQGI